VAADPQPDQGMVSVLTDDDLDKINGRRDQLIGMLQKKYGFTKEEATRELDDHLAQ